MSSEAKSNGKRGLGWMLLFGSAIAGFVATYKYYDPKLPTNCPDVDSKTLAIFGIIACIILIVQVGSRKLRKSEFPIPVMCRGDCLLLCFRFNQRHYLCCEHGVCYHWFENVVVLLLRDAIRCLDRTVYLPVLSVSDDEEFEVANGNRVDTFHCGSCESPLHSGVSDSCGCCISDGILCFVWRVPPVGSHASDATTWIGWGDDDCIHRCKRFQRLDCRTTSGNQSVHAADVLCSKRQGVYMDAVLVFYVDSNRGHVHWRLAHRVLFCDWCHVCRDFLLSGGPAIHLLVLGGFLHGGGRILSGILVFDGGNANLRHLSGCLGLA